MQMQMQMQMQIQNKKQMQTLNCAYQSIHGSHVPVMWRACPRSASVKVREEWEVVLRQQLACFKSPFSFELRLAKPKTKRQNDTHKKKRARACQNYSDAEMPKCPNGHCKKCQTLNPQMHKCTNAKCQMHKCQVPNAQLHKCTNESERGKLWESAVFECQGTTVK